MPVIIHGIDIISGVQAQTPGDERHIERELNRNRGDLDDLTPSTLRDLKRLGDFDFVDLRNLRRLRSKDLLWIA